MSRSPLTAGTMAPDSHTAMRDTTTSSSSPSPSQNTPTPTDPSALLTLMAIGPTPTPPPAFLPLLPGGILTKGRKLKKRVSFRDHNLVSVREIPPRPRRTSSSEEDGGDEDEESDEGEDSGTSDSEDDSEDSDSEEEEEEVVVVAGRKGVRKPPGVVTGKAIASSARPGPKTRSSTTSANSSLSSPRGPRADRSHPSPAAANTSSAPSAKGSYQVTSSSTSRVVSLVSQITGVSSAATQTHIKQRKAAATATKNTSSSSNAKQVTAVLRVEKKVKKVCPNLDSASTPQLVRVGQSKDGALPVTKGGQGRGAKKKRVSHPQRKQDTADRKKPATLRNNKETKASAKGRGSGGDNVDATKTEGVKLTALVNGLTSAKDSLSLPPLGAGEDHPSPPSKPLLKHAAAVPTKTPIFSVDGFIFPGDLAPGVKVKVNGRAEEAKAALPKAVRDRWSGAPPGSPGRRKRCHAWHMANGDLEGSLQEPPSITPMWETVTPVGTIPAASPLPPNR